MVIKRIRQQRERTTWSLPQVRRQVSSLTRYAIDARPDWLLEQTARADREAAMRNEAELLALGVHPGEKVHSYGARNFVGDGLTAIQAQMVAACLLAPEAKAPIEHYIMSWKEGELPTDKQIEEAVSIFANEMGYQDCQLLWAVHSNTNHRHIHLVVNRIDLVTARPVTPGEGWDIDMMHQVIALIEHRQGWSCEPNAIYYAKDGALYDSVTHDMVRRSDGTRSGLKRRKRQISNRASKRMTPQLRDALIQSSSWRDLHFRLAKLGAAYEKSSAGAAIRFQDERFKASDFGREYSLARMVDRLGPFEADAVKMPDAYEVYGQAVREQRQLLYEMLKLHLDQLKARRKAALHRIQEKCEVLSLVMRARVELAYDRAAKAIRAAYRKVHAQVTSMRLSRREWAKSKPPSFLKIEPPGVIFLPEASRMVDSPSLKVIHQKLSEDGKAVERAMVNEIARQGPVVVVHDTESQIAVEAALTLAADHCSSIEISGSESFEKKVAVSISAVGLEISDVSGRIISSPKPPLGASGPEPEPSGPEIRSNPNKVQRPNGKQKLEDRAIEARRVSIRAPEPEMDPSLLAALAAQKSKNVGR